MILIIDNYDSFTYNVYQSIAKLTDEQIKVVRSKEVTLKELIEMNPSKVVVSPGPGRPEDAGISVEAINILPEKFLYLEFVLDIRQSDMLSVLKLLGQSS